MPKDEQTLGQHSVPSIIVCQKAPSIADIIVKITPSSLKKQTIIAKTQAAEMGGDPYPVFWNILLKMSSFKERL